MTDTLVLVEHDGQRITGPSRKAIAAAAQFGDRYTLLVMGHELDAMSSQLAELGAERVLIADHAILAHPLADRYAALVAQVVHKAGTNTVVGASSTFTRDLLPRVAALLDAPMLSDVVAIDQQDGKTIYRRHTYAGNALTTATLRGDRHVVTIRAGAFASAPDGQGQSSPIEPIQLDADSLPRGTHFASAAPRLSDRPDLTEARIVVGGGRPLKDRATFEQLIGTLADALGGAVGCTRAAVDTGIAPNDWQIGQTGKTIAADLYIAVGVSGSVQHLAGIKDARVIVAINKDAEAPIFEIATYGIVGDLFHVVPELTAAVRAHRDETQEG